MLEQVFNLFETLQFGIVSLQIVETCENHGIKKDALKCFCMLFQLVVYKYGICTMP